MMMEASCSLEDVVEDTHEIMSWQTTSKFIYDEDNDEEEDNIISDNYTQKNDKLHLQPYHYKIHDQDIFRKRHRSSPNNWMFYTYHCYNWRPFERWARIPYPFPSYAISTIVNT